MSLTIRDWSLITGRGATKQEGGGHVKFYPYKKGGGAEKCFSHAEGGGHKKFLGSFYAVARSFSHIEGVVQKVSTL